MKKVRLLIGILLAALPSLAAPKNFVIILTDDQGYEDLSCFGSKRVQTPHIDQLAAEGMKLTSFYTASSVCTPSRASLLTGRIPKRAGLTNVLFPWSKNGLNPDEITIAELLKEQGYATAIVGKWHLGHEQRFLPANQGFDSFYGLPYSNDMWIAPEMKVAPDVVLKEGYTAEKIQLDMDEIVKMKGKPDGSLKGKMPLMRNTEIVEYPADQTTLTRRYTEEAIRFISSHNDQPFLLYLAHTFPHSPYYVSKAFEGASGNGTYCDTIYELDWSVGQVMAALKANGLQDDTLVIFCSDNGPAPAFYSKDPRGSAGPLSGVKFETMEGSQRVPAMVWAPGLIPAGTVSDEILSTLDLFPTIAHYAGAALPKDRVLDGYDLSAYLEGRASKSPRNEMYFYFSNSDKMDGVRVGDWKYLSQGYKDFKVLKRDAG